MALLSSRMLSIDQNQSFPALNMRNRNVTMDAPAGTAISLLISVFSGVLFGVMPLRQIFNADPNDAIKNGGGQTSAGGRRWALRIVWELRASREPFAAPSLGGVLGEAAALIAAS